VLVTFLLTLFLTDLTKEFVGRLRPNNAGELADLIRILQKPNSFSFFSGHASTSFAITTFVILSLRKYTRWIYLSLLWPSLFVLSRIYVGVHYPSDIIVGAGFGVLMALIFYTLSNWLLLKFQPVSAHPANGEPISDR
jgi:undecaprenyl-diphosphatase